MRNFSEISDRWGKGKRFPQFYLLQVKVRALCPFQSCYSQELKAGAIILFPSVHLKREENSGNQMLFKSVKNSSSKTSFFSSTPCKNTRHFLERKDSSSSQFQMSRSQTFGEVPNSHTDTFSSSSYWAMKIVVSHTCGTQGKAKFWFFFLF